MSLLEDFELSIIMTFNLTELSTLWLPDDLNSLLDDF